MRVCPRREEVAYMVNKQWDTWRTSSGHDIVADVECDFRRIIYALSPAIAHPAQPSLITLLFPQRGTTVTVAGLFKPLPVRRKELERNAKREYAKALTLLHAYALVPCARENAGVRLAVSNHPKGGCVIHSQSM